MTGDRPATSDGRRPWLLVLDTATSEIVVAAGDASGRLLGLTTRAAGRSHGEGLLPAIGRLTGEANLRRSRLTAVIVGTGPGAFTGLRVGLATAKTIAHQLGRPLVGVASGEALLHAANSASPADGRRAVLALPAGPADRVVVRAGQRPRRVAGAEAIEIGPDERLVALDLDGRAPAEALAAGAAARRGLAAALLELGLRRLDAGTTDEPAALVPEYVAPPRGVLGSDPSVGGEVAWSRDRR